MKGARPFDDLPLEREFVLDASPRTIAWQGPQLFRLPDPHHGRCRRHRHGDPRGRSAHCAGAAAISRSRDGDIKQSVGVSVMPGLGARRSPVRFLMTIV
jgi:hypothetical protein